MFRHLLNLLLWLMPPSRLFALRRFCLRLMGVSISRSVSFCGGGWIYGRGSLTIGNDTWLSPGTIIYTHHDAPIEIGECCDIGPFVRIITGSHEIGPAKRRAGKGMARPVTIGDGCWVGASSVLLGGITIGPGAIIAAGSIVTRDVAASTLVAGSPATVRRELK